MSQQIMTSNRPKHFISSTLKGLTVFAFAATLVFFVPANSLAVEIISDLYNTGVDDAVTPRVDGDLETHWELILIDRPAGENPVPPDDPFVQDMSGGFPIGPWLDDAADFDGDAPSDSRWITPSLDTNGPEADYHFETRFDLTGFDHTTAIINGGWSTDNPGVDIIVNGTSTGQTQNTSFVGWEPFDIPANLLVPGVNSLIFVAQNAAPDDNPAGLRVDFAVKEVMVPEPGAMAILGLGALLLSLAHRQRRRQK